MHSRERVVLYSLLTASITASALSLLVASSPTATAQNPTPSPTTIALSGTKGDLVLKNDGGRLAWSDNEFAKAYSVAYIHTGKVLKQLIESETYAEEMEALKKELEVAEAEFRRQLDDVSGRLRGLEKDSEDFKRTYEEGQKVYDEYRKWGQTATERHDALEVAHYEKSYRQLVEAVEVVSDRKNIDIVYRFIPTAESFKATDSSEAMDEIRLRTVLKYPQGLDITPDVLKELSLNDE